MNELLQHISGHKGSLYSGEIGIFYRSSAVEKLRKLRFFYSDSFFSHSACVYDHGLAELSLGFTLSAVSYKSYGARYITSTLCQAGFDARSIEAVKFEDSVSTDDSCAYAIASKRLADGSYLVPVIIRGHQYGGEWVSNVHVVSDDNPDFAAGFLAAAEGVENALKEYLTERGLDAKRVKLWIAGFSRGGAVANLLGARLVDGGANPEQVFVYTFAAPRTVRDSAWRCYCNIFNIVNEADAVPRVPLVKWSYRRFGTDLYLPCAARRGADTYARLLADMVFQFDSIMEETLCGGVHYEIYDDQELTLDLLIDYADDLLITPEKYMNEGYQDILMEYMKCRTKGDSLKLDRFFRFLLSDNRALARSLCQLMDSWDTLKPLERGKRISSIAAGVAKQQSSKKTAAAEILGTGTSILLHYAAKRTATLVGGRDKDYYYEQLTKLIADLYRRGKDSALLKQHWAETYLAWLRSADEHTLYRTDTYERFSVK